MGMAYRYLAFGGPAMPTFYASSSINCTLRSCLLFPLTFLSNAFVPSEGLPTPLRVFAEWNPVTALVTSARQLFGNVPAGTPVGDAWPAQHPIPTVIVGIVVLLLVFVPLSIRRFATLNR